MTSLRALPDFGELLNVGGQVLFPSLDEPDRFLHVPQELEVAPREQRVSEPDFRLELVRHPNDPSASYGILDFRLRATPIAEPVLVALREISSHAVVGPALFSQGCLRLLALSGENTDEAEFETPTHLASNALDTARCLRRLSPEGAVRVKRVLIESALTWTALAEMEVIGVARRMSGRIEFRVADLLARLAALADASGRLKRQALIEFWTQDFTALPVTTSGLDAVDKLVRAETLADWTAAEYSEFAASGDGPVEATVRLRPAVAPEQVAVWDLSTRRSVPRTFVMRLNPFAAAQQVVGTRGIEAVVHETEVSSFETGLVTIFVATNLPTSIQGVLKLGVALIAPPNPPMRVQPLTATILFDESDQVQKVSWRFSPREPVAYQYTAFALLSTLGGPRRLDGRATQHSGSYLLMRPDDFPLHFVPLKASELLLGLATVEGICQYSEPARVGEEPAQPFRTPEARLASESVPGGGVAVTVPFRLSTERPVLTLALPREVASAATLLLEAESVETHARKPIGQFPAQGLAIDLISLREYGPHVIDVEAEFDRDVPLVAVDLLAESDSDDASHVDVVALTPERPSARWNYFARSPFQSGYRFRRHTEGGPAAAWSATQGPFASLRVRTSEFA